MIASVREFTTVCEFTAEESDGVLSALPELTGMPEEGTIDEDPVAPAEYPEEPVDTLAADVPDEVVPVDADVPVDAATRTIHTGLPEEFSVITRMSPTSISDTVAAVQLPVSDEYEYTGRLASGVITELCVNKDVSSPEQAV